MSNDSQLFQKSTVFSIHSIFPPLQEFTMDILQSGLLLRWNSYPQDSCCFTKLQPIKLCAMSHRIILCCRMVLTTSSHVPYRVGDAFPWRASVADTTVWFSTAEHLAVPEGFTEQHPDACSMDAAVTCPLSQRLQSAEEQKGVRAADPGSSLNHEDCTFSLFPKLMLHHLSHSSQRKKNKSRSYTLEKQWVYLAAADLVTVVTLYMASHPFCQLPMWCFDNSGMRFTATQSQLETLQMNIHSMLLSFLFIEKLALTITYFLTNILSASPASKFALWSLGITLALLNFPK